MYEHLSDEELYIMATTGERSCLEALYKRYMKKYNCIIPQCLRKNEPPIDDEELMAIYVEAFHRCLCSYRTNIIPFDNFFATIIKRSVSNHYRKILASKEALYRKFSLSTKHDKMDDDEIYDTIINNVNNYDEVKSYVNVTESREVLNDFDVEYLSDKRLALLKNTVKLKLQGFSFREIAKKLDVDVGVIKRILKLADDSDLKSKMADCLK